MKRQSTLKKLMAYIFMPLAFIIIGYVIVYVMASPFIDTVNSVIGLITSSTTPVFETELNDIYEVPAETEPDIESISDIETVPLSEINIPAYETKYGEISCDRIGLDADLYYGDSSRVLRVGVGQYAGTRIPGFGTPILLAAHNTTYFLPLKDAVEGDIIKITTSYGIYQYQVTDMKVADKNDESAYDLSQDKEQLMMYTCYPFNTLGSLNDRYFVYCDKISGPVIDIDK